MRSFAPRFAAQQRQFLSPRGRAPDPTALRAVQHYRGKFAAVVLMEAVPCSVDLALTPPIALGGTSLMGVGLYFIFLRVPLLPEDTRFMGTSLLTIQASVPDLSAWLTHVFWVLGGFMLTTGLLTGHLALSSFRQRARGAATIAALVGLTSIGWMSVVNFMIASDFKWLLLAFTVPWALALVLYWVEGSKLQQVALRDSL